MFRLLPPLTILAVYVAPGASAAWLHATVTHTGRNAVSKRAQISLNGSDQFLTTAAPSKPTTTSFRPQITAKEFLIISSPKLGKVVYTALKNFKSTFGRTYALIDSGLSQPCGIAMDPVRGHLYVADRGVNKIFRYSIYVLSSTDRDGATTYSITTDNTRLTILSGHTVEWVTVDRDGDVFYSATDTNNINKITSQVMSNLADGYFSSESLQIVSEKDQEAESSANAQTETNTLTQTVTDPPPPARTILSIYEAAINPHVSAPSGVTTDGLRLFWGNSANGKASGSLVVGEVNPKPPPTLSSGSDPKPFPSTPLSNASNAVQGVVKAGAFVFFSTNGSAGGNVLGVPQTGGTELEFVSGLSEPRGLAWDGDNTVYVADENAGAVSSFPSGRLIEGAPLTKTVDFEGAFGVAVLTQMDEAWVRKSRASASHGPSLLLASMLALSFWAAAVVT